MTRLMFWFSSILLSVGATSCSTWAQGEAASAPPLSPTLGRYICDATLEVGGDRSVRAQVSGLVSYRRDEDEANGLLYSISALESPPGVIGEDKAIEGYGTLGSWRLNIPVSGEAEGTGPAAAYARLLQQVARQAEAALPESHRGVVVETPVRVPGIPSSVLDELTYRHVVHLVDDAELGPLIAVNAATTPFKVSFGMARGPDLIGLHAVLVVRNRQTGEILLAVSSLGLGKDDPIRDSLFRVEQSFVADRGDNTTELMSRLVKLFRKEITAVPLVQNPIKNADSSRVADWMPLALYTADLINVAGYVVTEQSVNPLAGPVVPAANGWISAATSLYRGFIDRMDVLARSGRMPPTYQAWNDQIVSASGRVRTTEMRARPSSIRRKLSEYAGQSLDGGPLDGSASAIREAVGQIQRPVDQLQSSLQLGEVVAAVSVTDDTFNLGWLAAGAAVAGGAAAIAGGGGGGGGGGGSGGGGSGVPAGPSQDLCDPGAFVAPIDIVRAIRFNRLDQGSFIRTIPFQGENDAQSNSTQIVNAIASVCPNARVDFELIWADRGLFSPDGMGIINDPTPDRFILRYNGQVVLDSMSQPGEVGNPGRASTIVPLTADRFQIEVVAGSPTSTWVVEVRSQLRPFD